MPNFHVAIIGGGLCGLALAVALRRRKISFTVYESRGSFTELGAGINVSPNSRTAFSLIDPALTEAFYMNAARNSSPREGLWFDIRLGAATETRQDGETITSLMAPPIGNTCIGRNDLLQILAEKAGLLDGPGRENAAFNEKLIEFRETTTTSVRRRHLSTCQRCHWV